MLKISSSNCALQLKLAPPPPREEVGLPTSEPQSDLDAPPLMMAIYSLVFFFATAACFFFFLLAKKPLSIALLLLGLPPSESPGVFRFLPSEGALLA